MPAPWRVARSLQTLRDQIDDRYPNRNRASDGTIGDAEHATRDSDHNPWYVLNSEPLVTALDITHDPGAGVDIDRLTDELQASRDPRIKYIIANGLIMSGAAGPSPWVWRSYSGPSPHSRHFHLSVVASPACDDTSPWNLPSLRVGGGGSTPPSQEDDMPSAEEVAEAVWTFWITNRRLKKREYAETLLGSSEDRIIRQQIAPLRADVSGLREAYRQDQAGEVRDLDAIEAAAQRGAQAAIEDHDDFVDEAELADELAPTLAEMLPRIPDEQMTQLVEQIPEETRRVLADALHKEGSAA